MVMKQVQVHQVRVQDQLQYSSIRCPRCDSENTKFCYYNNYSLSQPRHFCKACKRYWTRGGTLRSVPVGGGSRKNKRNKRAKVGVGVGVTATSTRKKDVNGMFYGLEIKNQTESGLSFQRELSTSCNGYGIDQSLYNGFLPLGIESSSAREIHEVMNLNTNFVSFSGFESSFIDSSLEQQPLIMLDGLNESVTTSNDQAMFPFNDVADLIPAAKEVKIEQGSDLMGNKLDLGAPCIEPMFSLDSTVNWSMIWPDLSNYASSITSLI